MKAATPSRTRRTLRSKKRKPKRVVGQSPSPAPARKSSFMDAIMNTFGSMSLSGSSEGGVRTISKRQHSNRKIKQKAENRTAENPMFEKKKTDKNFNVEESYIYSTYYKKKRKSQRINNENVQRTNENESLSKKELRRLKKKSSKHVNILESDEDVGNNSSGLLNRLSLRSSKSFSSANEEDQKRISQLSTGELLKLSNEVLNRVSSTGSDENKKNMLRRSDSSSGLNLFRVSLDVMQPVPDEDVELIRLRPRPEIESLRRSNERPMFQPQPKQKIISRSPRMVELEVPSLSGCSLPSRPSALAMTNLSRDSHLLMYISGGSRRFSGSSLSLTLSKESETVLCDSCEKVSEESELLSAGGNGEVCEECYISLLGEKAFKRARVRKKLKDQKTLAAKPFGGQQKTNSEPRVSEISDKLL